MPIATRGWKQETRNDQNCAPAFQKPLVDTKLPKEECDPCIERKARGPNEAQLVSFDEEESRAAATRFLQFCNEAWSEIRSTSPVQSSAAEDIELGSHGNHQARPAAQQRLSERSIRVQQTTASINSSLWKIPATPPGFKVSSRIPKPGEPPLWGVFADSSESLKSPIRLRLRKKPKVPEATIESGLSMVQFDRSTLRASSEPLRSSTVGIRRDIMPAPHRPPKGGTLMYTVKQNNKLKRLQHNQRLHIAPPKACVGLLDMQKSMHTDREIGGGTAAVHMIAEMCKRTVG